MSLIKFKSLRMFGIIRILQLVQNDSKALYYSVTNVFTCAMFIKACFKSVFIPYVSISCTQGSEVSPGLSCRWYVS